MLDLQIGGKASLVLYVQCGKLAHSRYTRVNMVIPKFSLIFANKKRSKDTAR